MNIAELISEQAQLQPYRHAVIFPQGKDHRGNVRYTHYTFAQFAEAATALACKLQAAGFRKGIRTLMFVRPSLEFPLLTFALFKIGAIPVLIDPGMGRTNLIGAVRSVQPEALIGVPEIHIARVIFRSAFQGVRIAITTGRRGWGLALPLDSLLRPTNVSQPLPSIGADDTAAIVFTSGGTGTPKGVVYTHGIFAQQVELLRQMFAFSPMDRDLSCFPLFALVSMAMGVTSVIPDMDAARPAQVDPAKLVRTIFDHGITTASGSPAIWERVARFCGEHNLTLPSVRALMMFGAPVRTELHQAFAHILPNGNTFTPYGATECLPVACIDGKTILRETANATRNGAGTCIGFPAPATQVRIATDVTTTSFRELPPGEVGEILVQGAQGTRSYWNNPNATVHGKVSEPHGAFWHRMGDLGYQDAAGRLWFCGRAVHQVQIPELGKALYPIPCEAIFNTHGEIRRTALVAIGHGNRKKPAIVIERRDRKTSMNPTAASRFKGELLTLARSQPHTQVIDTFFLAADFPVDTRHNIKIDRSALGKKLFKKAQLLGARSEKAEFTC